MSLSRINVFQRLTRQWDQLHPYNAAQILKIQGPPPVASLQDAWHDAMEDLGLGRVHLAGNRLFYECLNGEMSHYGVRFVKPGLGLEAHISEQLNQPFDNPAEPPFRPFVVAEDGFYYAGVVYHHWIADSVSIRSLLREWFVRMYDPPRASRRPARLAQQGYRGFFDLTRDAAAMAKGLLTATRWTSSLRHSCRLEIRGGIDLSVRFALRPVQEGWIHHAHAAAKERGATLNDLFMAALAQVCNRHVPLKHRPRRHSVALGSIVDLRPYAQGELDDAFGLFLGFTNVVCRPGELKDPERLIRAVALQCAQQKNRGIPQASALRMLAGILAGRFVEPAKMPWFYQKYIPLAGGISNVNMSRSWAIEYHPAPLLDYVRVSPTGPMMPLVLATTTLGNTFHFTLTYRPSIVPTHQIDAMADTFKNFLAALR